MPDSPRLKTLQGQFFDLVRRPLDDRFRMSSLPRSGRLSQKSVQQLVKPNQKMTSSERLEIYARQYWFRVLDSLIEDYPGVRAILGAAKFDSLIEAYLVKFPSRSHTLRNLGNRFPAFLTRHASLQNARGRAAADMARLEWAKIEAFDEAELPLLQPETLAAGRMPRIRVQPHLRLLSLSYPVDEWLVKLNREEWRAEASNAVAAGGRRRRAAAGAPVLRRKNVCVVVHRHEFRPYFKRLDREAFVLLQELQKGRSFESAVQSALKIKRHSNVWWQNHLRQWFAEWSALGWLASRGK